MLEKLIPIIVSILMLICWILLIQFPSYFFYIFGIQLIIFIASLLKFNKFKFKNKDFWLLLTPGFFLVSLTTVFLLFLNFRWLSYLVAFLVAISLYYFLRYLYYFLCYITKYKALTLESLSSYFNIISYLFLSIIIYGLINFLSLKLWYLAVVLIIITYILTYQFFWISKIEEKNNSFASLIISILMVEFFWSMSFFPISHFISGLSLGIIYYVIINLILFNFLGKLDKKAVRVYLTIGIGCLMVILLSAKWL